MQQFWAMRGLWQCQCQWHWPGRHLVPGPVTAAWSWSKFDQYCYFIRWSDQGDNNNNNVNIFQRFLKTSHDKRSDMKMWCYIMWQVWWWTLVNTGHWPSVLTTDTSLKTISKIFAVERNWLHYDTQTKWNFETLVKLEMWPPSTADFQWTLDKPNIAKMSLNSPSLESEPPPPPPTLDSVLGKLGNPGKYQV